MDDYTVASCDYLLKTPDDEKKFNERYNTLFDQMDIFIKANDLSEAVSINRLLLCAAVRDYFIDVRRLKEFQSLDHTNSIKITAYTAFWILRKKPLQVCDNEKAAKAYTDGCDLTIINERFVSLYICNYLSARPRKSHILLRQEWWLKSFANMLLYYLIYRLRDARSLELMLLAFLAGQVYERTDNDISGELHPFDQADQPANQGDGEKKPDV